MGMGMGMGMGMRVPMVSDMSNVYVRSEGILQGKGDAVRSVRNRYSPKGELLLIQIRSCPIFFKADRFQRRTPVTIIGISGVGITLGLSASNGVCHAFHPFSRKDMSLFYE